MQFNEDEWLIYLIEDEDFVVSDADAAAETRFLERELYFRKKHLSLNVICHELWHLYFGYTYLSDAIELNLHSIEEVSASLFADKAERILLKAKDIYEQLKQLKAEENEDDGTK